MLDTGTFEAVTRTAEATEALAARLAFHLLPGDVVCLRGDLGAGKTTWTRGLARGLGSQALVSSPTFTLLHEYEGGRLPVYHMDAYRLTGSNDAFFVGLDEYLSHADGVTVIEWPERIEAALPDERLDIFLQDAGTNENEARRLTFCGRGKRGQVIVNAFAADGNAEPARC